MPRPKFSVSPAASNAGFAEVIGVLELKWNRAGNSYPSSLQAVVAVDESVDGVSGLKRFYPFLHAKLEFVEYEDGLGDAVAFIGRIDEAEQREDDRYGRVWDIKARDYLAVMADNFIDRGPSNYVPNYVGTFKKRRKDIIEDLALKIVTNPASEIILLVDKSVAPNSKEIEQNYDNQSNIRILDAIRQLAQSDPWDTGIGGETDGKAIADAGFPFGTGFGAEFQILIETGAGATSGRDTEYYIRGSVATGATYVYGDPAVSLQGADLHIAAYSFDREGTDIFSRVRTAGKGEATNRQGYAGAGGGSGVVVTDMESSWDPENGKFNVRRESPTRFEGDVGDWFSEALPGETDKIRSRALKDRSFGQLLAGGAGLNTTRGVSRGRITVPGVPAIDSQPNHLTPGNLLRVIIPQMGLNDDGGSESTPQSINNFIIDNWVYTYPEHVTTIELSRRSYVDLSDALVRGKTGSEDSAAGHNSFYDSYWRLVDGTGTIMLQHNLGVRPSKVSVQAAIDSGITTFASGNPATRIPMHNTETDVPATAFEASQGQNHGYAIIENNANQITIKVSRWLAHSEGAGKWMKSNDLDVIYRVRLLP